ncbi:MAG: hypothetical protein JW915_03095 [Chitinispirillaceae bacterium]|nr:hypothetical protein [Chitinispirillaceae bacterium]
MQKNSSSIFPRIVLLILYCSVFSFSQFEWKQSITKDSLPYQTSLNGIVFGNGQFFIGGWNFNGIVSGSSGHATYEPDPLVLTSSNVQIWTKTVVDSSIQFTSIAYGNTTFTVLASNNSVWYLKENKSDTSDKQILLRNYKFQVKIVTSKTNISIHVLDNTSLHSPAKIALFTCAGRRLCEYFSTPINNTFTFPVNGIPAGKYYVSFDYGNGEKNTHFLL